MLSILLKKLNTFPIYSIRAKSIGEPVILSDDEMELMEKNSKHTVK